MVVCDNDTCWNFACNMIKRPLQLYHQIDTFYAVNQRSTKKVRIENDNDRSIRCNKLSPTDWKMMKCLYNLTKTFRDFMAWIEDHAVNSSHKALWEVLLALELLVTKYKQFAAYHISLILCQYLI